MNKSYQNFSVYIAKTNEWRLPRESDRNSSSLQCQTNIS